MGIERENCTGRHSGMEQNVSFIPKPRYFWKIFRDFSMHCCENNIMGNLDLAVHEFKDVILFSNCKAYDDHPRRSALTFLQIPVSCV